MKFNRIYILDQLSGDVYSTDELLPYLNSNQRIKSYVEKGYIQKIMNGFYAVDVPMGKELPSVIRKYFQGAIVADYSALFYRNLFDYQPAELQLHIPLECNYRDREEVKFKRVTSYRLSFGIEPIKVAGVTLKGFSPERCLFEIVGNTPNSEAYLKSVVNYYRAYGFNRFDNILRLSRYYPKNRFLIINTSLQTLKEFNNIY